MSAGIYNTFIQQRAAPGNLSDRNDFPSPITRDFGGKGRSGQWYTPGYWQLILSPPDAVFNGVGTNPADGQGLENFSQDDSFNSSAFEQLANSTCTNFTPHDRTMGITEDTAQGGIKSNYINGSNEVTNTFTIEFKEIQGLGVYQMYKLWTSVCDPYTGVSALKADEFNPSHYKGDCYALLLKPTFSGQDRELLHMDVEEVFYYDGVFPSQEPVQTLNQDLQSHDIVNHSIEFKFDGYPMSKSMGCTLDRAVEEFNARFHLNNYYNKHYNCKTGPISATNTGKYAVYGSRSGMKNAGRGTFG